MDRSKLSRTERSREAKSRETRERREEKGCVKQEDEERGDFEKWIYRVRKKKHTKRNTREGEFPANRVRIFFLYIADFLHLSATLSLSLLDIVSLLSGRESDLEPH
eukprot:scaffold55267_cov35-Tisochrysis_lutea.AAC.1